MVDRGRPERQSLRCNRLACPRVSHHFAGAIVQYLEPKELQVQALALDKNGVLYAATNPDGKVYRIERQIGAPAAKGKAETEKTKTAGDFSASMYFDPGTKYIWDLAFDNSGNLYVATGDHGEIYRVTPKGEHSLFFKSDEAHIRVLSVDTKGNLIAGSDGSGLVYQIKPSGEGSCCTAHPKKRSPRWPSTRREIFMPPGLGRTPWAGPSIFPPPVTTPTPGPAGRQQPGMVVLNVNPSPSALASSIPLPVLEQAAVQKFTVSLLTDLPAAFGLRVTTWCMPGIDPAGRLLAGAGNRGHVFAITGEDRFVDCSRPAPPRLPLSPKLRGEASMFPPVISAKCPAGWVSGSEGSYESDVFDGKVFSRWGALNCANRSGAAFCPSAA